MRLRSVIAASTAVWSMTLAVTALVAAAPGAAELVRGAFAFRLDAGRPGTWGEAAGYFATNLRVVAAIHLAAWTRARSGPLGPLIDVVVGSTVTINAAVVGAALGAYGVRALPWLVHLPLEWAALGVAVSAYAAGRREFLATSTLLRTLVSACVLLGAAATVEAFAVL